MKLKKSKYTLKIKYFTFCNPGDFSSLNLIKRLNFPAIKILLDY